MILSKKNKNKLIGALIVVIATTLTLGIKSFFSSNNTPNKTSIDTTKQTSQTPSIVTTNNDSSKQNINQLNQINQNKGNVTTELISGDKKTYNTNNTYHNSKKNEANPVINNGIINNGGTGNTYNQSVGKQQRHYTPDILNWVSQNIPINYNIDFIFMMNDIETKIYATELADSLNNHGYKASATQFALTDNQTYGKLGISIDTGRKLFQVYVYSNL